MKKIEVACAIIEKDGLVLVAQRSETMSFPLKWEFPGGKLDPQESPAACLQREIEEELEVGVRIVASLPSSDWRYPDFAVTLHPFVCELAGGELRTVEHRALQWLAPQELHQLDWLEGDGPVIENYLCYLRKVR